MYDVSVVDSLIYIEIKILDSFYKLSCCYDDKIKFNNELNFLINVLIKKEDILISKLPTFDEALNIIFDDISDNKSNFFENEYQSYFVMERIQNIFHDLLIVIDDSVYSDDDYELNNSPKIRKNIRDNMGIEFIKLLDGLVLQNRDLSKYLNKIIFMDIYSSKKNSNYFFKNGFNFDNISIASDEIMIRKFNLDSSDYYSVKNDEIYSMLEDLATNLLETVGANENSSVLSYFMMKFKFLIHILGDGQLGVFRTYFLNFVKSLNDLDCIGEFISVLEDETKKRGFNVVEKNKMAPKIENDKLALFIELIKLEGRFFELYKLIDFNKYDYNIISSLKSMIYIENDFLNKIVISKKDESVYRRLIESDLSFFLPFEDDDLSLISKRLLNILPYFNNLDVSPTQSVFCFDYVRKNHIIRSLKKYIKYLEDNNSFCNIDYLKKIIYLNGFLTFDFIVSDCNYKLIEDLSDDIVFQILDMNCMEFEFDKNEQLIRRADNIVCDIEELDDEADIFFRLLELEDIKENLNDEYLIKLNSDIIPSNFHFNSSIKKGMIKLLKK